MLERRQYRFRGVLLVCACLLQGCGLAEPDASAAGAAFATGGDADRGRVLLPAYGCDACHTIPGIPGADRTVGPSLEGIARRMFIAGRLPNNPDNLVNWISDPPAIDSMTAMPNVGVTEQDARDISAYLYTMD
jgi:cytochrome c